jgi:hypothetical protein
MHHSNSSIHPSIHLSIQSFIHLSIHPFTNPLIHPSIHAHTHSSLTTVGIRAPLPLLMPSFLSQLSDDLQILFLSLWLDVRSLSTLDIAISCRRLRPCWMTILQCLRSPCRRLESQSVVTDVVIKARDSFFASANEDGHFASTCLRYIAD